MNKLLIALCICAYGLPCSADETFATWTELSPTYDPYAGVQLDEDYFPCVIYDHSKFHGHGARHHYKMWHQGGSGLDVSYSDDGVNWIKQNTDIPAPVYHPAVVYSAKGFPEGGSSRYKMWYWNGNLTINGIQFCQSTDGVNWTVPVQITQDSEFPLATGVDGYFYHLYGPGSVVYNPDGTDTAGDPYSFHYVMFFDTATEGNPPIGSSNVEQVGLAYSSDGLAWTRYGTEPVFIPSGNPADWDGTHHFGAKIFKMNQYHMYYSGSNDHIDSDTTVPYAHGIGHAVSSDGIHWTADSANPVFIYSDGVAWRDSRTYTPCVIYNTFHDSENNDPYLDLLKMWFTGGTGLSAGIDRAVGPAVLPYPQIPYTAAPIIENHRHSVRISWSLDTLSSFANDIDQILIFRLQHGKSVLIGQVPKTTMTFDDVGMKNIPTYKIVPTFPGND